MIQVATPPSANHPLNSVQSTLLRLVEIVEEENAALRRPVSITHTAFTERKNQALRDLMAAQRRDAASIASLRGSPLIERLSVAMRDNARILKLHIAAVGEISDIIISGLREAESDGTYARSRLIR